MNSLKRLKEHSGVDASRPDPILSTEAACEQAVGSLCAQGDALLAGGAPEAALAAYQAAIEIPQTCVAGHIGQAKAYVALGSIDDALDSLEIALALNSNAVEAIGLLARLRRESGEARTAIDLLHRAIALAPDRADLRADLALALNGIGRTEEAMGAYREALELDPAAPGPRINLGLIYLQQLGDPVSAESCFRDALAVSPQFVPAIANLGLAVHDQGRHEQALEIYQRGLLKHPDSVELRWNRAVTRLSIGELASGWDDYELRFRRPGGRDLRRLDYPDWDGARVRGRLLVLAEQGLGDEIMFASCLPDLQQLAHATIVECAPRLATLFSRSFPHVSVHGMDRGTSCAWISSYSDIAAKIAIGSLPRWLRRSPEAYPCHSGYLRADSHKVAEYRRRLQALGGGMTIGLSWRAGTPKTRGALRSIAFAQLAALSATPNTRSVCLQHGLDERECEAARAAGLVVWNESIQDLDEVAALICALDLVITVANTNAHLCGALGRPGWVLLNENPEWRWSCSGENPLWYPSLSLFRCGRGEGWQPVLGTVMKVLATHAANSGMPDGTSRKEARP